MSYGRQHDLIVHITCDDAQGKHQAADRLTRWLEANGHTAPGHGFRFTSVGAVVQNRLRAKPDAS